MDLTPLVERPELNVKEYVLGYIEKLRADVDARITKLG
jgi:hypothetical protein